MKLDFGAIGLKDALDLAIQIEEDARDRYVALAGQLRLHQRSPRVAAFFESLAQLEESHRGILLIQRERRFGDAPRTVDLSQLEEGVEGPLIEDARVKLTLRDALEAALDAEERAKDFFERALVQVTDPEVGELFAELREEEIEHRDLVHRELQHVPKPKAGVLYAGPMES